MTRGFKEKMAYRRFMPLLREELERSGLGLHNAEVGPKVDRSGAALIALRAELSAEEQAQAEALFDWCLLTPPERRLPTRMPAPPETGEALEQAARRHLGRPGRPGMEAWLIVYVITYARAFQRYLEKR